MVTTALDHGMAPHYQVLPEWERLPTGYQHGDVVGVAVDSGDRVFVLTRRDAAASSTSRMERSSARSVRICSPSASTP